MLSRQNFFTRLVVAEMIDASVSSLAINVHVRLLSYFVLIKLDETEAAQPIIFSLENKSSCTSLGSSVQF